MNKNYTLQEAFDYAKWSNKIEPHLKNYDKDQVLKILSDWEGESLAKNDLLSLVHKHFQHAILK